MSHKHNILYKFFTYISIISMLLLSNASSLPVQAASGFSFVILSEYNKTLKIGDEFYLVAVASNGKMPAFSSSNSKVASVNTYGKVSAKKAGSATITAKVKGGEASCKVTVAKTKITLSKRSASLYPGCGILLKAESSTGHEVSWRSSKSSVASVSEGGYVLAKKPGSATITATVDKTSVTCKITVKEPKVTLSRSTASLYRNQTIQLSVTTNSKSKPVWKSNKKSVAVVDSTGNVTAVKHGTAVISVTVDGVKKTCELTVKKPVIKFRPDKITLNKGQLYTPSVTVSSGNTPEYSSSNINIASVDENGRIYARQSGKAYIYATEDGTKASLIVTVR